ncbi:hypothetical protein [Natrinema versiforme]|uniref:hypothetical protein n=1 Tax=Natrinema versiforme TaxID=88724 RepID=UPI00126840D7|nr:hypothetical protein [Natrinema versiforme]
MRDINEDWNLRGQIWQKMRDSLPEGVSRIDELPGDKTIEIELTKDELSILDSSTQLSTERDGAFSSSITLIRLAAEILETYKKMEEGAKEAFSYDSSPEVSKREIYEIQQEALENGVLKELSDEIILFFTLSSGVIEDYCIDLINREMIDSEYRDSNKTDTLLQNKLNQKTREELLLRCGIIEKSLHDEIRYILQIRNRLVHDVKEQQQLNPVEDVQSDIRRAVKVVNSLYELNGGDSIIWPEDM